MLLFQKKEYFYDIINSDKYHEKHRLHDTLASIIDAIIM
jgi:hypothetical protein